MNRKADRHGLKRSSKSSQNPLNRSWDYQPDLNTQLPPYYRWPPNVLLTLRHMAKSWSLLDVRIYVLGLSLLVWRFFSPALERCNNFSADWIIEIWLRHFLVILAVAGGLHLYFYTFNKQGNAEKYDPRDLARDSRVFHFNNQVWDNMFWVLTSTVGFLTFYEVLMMWAYANGVATMLVPNESPLWFISLLLLIPGWTSFHFYCQHRIFHIPIFYKMGHHWHHKNISVGPWSGAAVNPIENFIWFSAVLVLLVLPSHPMHAIFLIQLQVITAITTHCGYENLIIGKHTKFRLGDFFHQLHHRFYECNYGTISAPWDRLFNTYHDGTLESDAWIKRRRKNMRRPTK